MADDEVFERAMQVPDGRTVAWTECGPADGVPLLRIPGTPGSRWQIRSDRTPWRERNLRVLTAERPGFGASTRLPGRHFAEHADDLAAILDSVGMDSAFVLGASGAAPHILDFASRHPGRVRAVSILAGAAPLTGEQVDDMIEVNRRGFTMARAGDRDGVAAFLGPVRKALLADPLGGIRGIMTTAPPGDQAVINDPPWQEAFCRAIREALGASLDGWVDETMAITNDWPLIELAGVRASVTWWHSAADRNAPLAAAQALVAQLPTAMLNIWPHDGHFAAYTHEGIILDELLGRA